MSLYYKLTELKAAYIKKMPDKMLQETELVNDSDHYTFNLKLPRVFVEPDDAEDYRNDVVLYKFKRGVMYGYDIVEDSYRTFDLITNRDWWDHFPLETLIEFNDAKPL